jgi:hypothetical protein
MEPNETSIKDKVEALDDLVPKNGGRVSFQIYGGGPGECRIVANKIGYYRLGIELMKAGYKPAESIDDPVSESIDVDLKGILDENSELNFDWFERTENWNERRPPSTSPWQLKAIGIFLATLLLVGVIMSVIGVISTFRYLIE